MERERLFLMASVDRNKTSIQTIDHITLTNCSLKLPEEIQGTAASLLKLT